MESYLEEDNTNNNQIDDIEDDVDIDLTKYSDPENVPVLEPHSTPNTDIVICGVDPGTANAGFGFYSLQKKKGIYCKRVSFKKKGEKKIKELELIKRFSEFMQSGFKDTLNKYGVKFYSAENQRHSKFEHETYHNRPATSYRSSGGGVHDTIPGVLATLYPGRFAMVAPSAVKDYFRDYFPEDSNLTEDQQYRMNKKSAIEYAKTFCSTQAMQMLCNEKKQDDAADALVVAKYCAENYFDEFDDFKFSPDIEHVKQIRKKRKQEAKRQAKLLKPPPKKRRKKKEEHEKTTKEEEIPTSKEQKMEE